MLACREVSRLVSSEDIGHVGLLRRLELRLHLMMCRHCRNYVRQVGLIGSVARRIWGSEGEGVENMAELERRVLKAVRTAKESKPPSDAESDRPRPEA
jgi:hypothetical protein